MAEEFAQFAEKLANFSYSGRASAATLGALVEKYPFSVGHFPLVTTIKGVAASRRISFFLDSCFSMCSLVLRIKKQIKRGAGMVSREREAGAKWIVLFLAMIAWTGTGATNITWTNLSPYAIAFGNGVQKTSGPSDWVCGPHSVENIPSGDFYIEFPVNETDKHRHIGFRDSPEILNNYYSLTASIRVQADSKAYSYIGSGSATYLGAVSVGTMLKIEVASGTVSFFLNGTQVGNSYTPTINYPVHVDTCLHSNGGSFTDVNFAAIGGAVAQANDADDGDNLYGAADEIVVTFDSSTGSPTGGVDTLFSFSQSIGTSYTGAWNTAGDVYTITINTPAATPPARISTIITGIGALDGLSMPLIGDWGGRPVTWASINLDPSANGTLTKSGPSSNWNAGAISNETVLEGLGDFGFVEARVTENNTKLAIGLSKGDSSTSYSDIDFSLFTASDGSLRVYEGGSEKHNHGSFGAGARCP